MRFVLPPLSVLLIVLNGSSPAQQPEDVPAPPPVDSQPPPPRDPLEIPAETVPLPAEKPAGPAAENANAELTLSCDTPQLKPGQPALFSLYGPEIFLRAAAAHLIVEDE